MNYVRTFETKENRINREIDELSSQIPEINEEIKMEFNRFDLKLNNGCKITEDDVKSLFTGLYKKYKINAQIEEKLQEKGIDMSDVPTLDDIVNEVFKECE